MLPLFIGMLVAAAILDAFRDTIYSHFSTSIFSNLNTKFWKALDSWQYARRIFGYPVDAWHLAKSATLAILLCFVGIALTRYYSLTGVLPYDVILFTLAAAAIWIIVFNLFYNIIFKRK